MIKLRPVEKKDGAFIETVYRSTREDELQLTNWTEQQKKAFIMMQSMAQLADYTARFPGAAFQVIVYKKKDAGRFYTWENDTTIHLIDITLLPPFRGKGIGTSLMNDLVRRSGKTKKKIALHVIPSNPALRLYKRLGFVHISNNGMHYYMEREAG